MKNMTQEQKKILFPDNMVLLGHGSCDFHRLFFKGDNLKSWSLFWL